MLWLLDGEMADGALQAELRATEVPSILAEAAKNQGLFFWIGTISMVAASL